MEFEKQLDEKKLKNKISVARGSECKVPASNSVAIGSDIISERDPNEIFISIKDNLNPY